MEHHELISLYILGTLNEEQKQQFDHLMATDPKFKKELEFQTNVKAVITEEEKDITKAKLQAIENEYSQSSVKPKTWLVAASVIVLLGFSFLWLNKKPMDNRAIFDKYFEPYRNVVQPTVRGDNNSDVKSKAFEAYEAGNYALALKNFNTVLKENKDSSIEFYKGLVLLELDNDKEALFVFENLKNLPNSLETQYQWYLALTYIKNNELELGKTTLQTLNTKDSEFKNAEIDRLLRALD